jgi:hypothetical protein
MCSSADCTVLPCGSSTSRLGVMMTFALIEYRAQERQLGLAGQGAFFGVIDKGQSGPLKNTIIF